MRQFFFNFFSALPLNIVSAVVTAAYRKNDDVFIGGLSVISAAVLLSLLSGATLKKDELSEDSIYEDHSYNLFRDVEVTARQNVATACSALVAGSLLFAVTEEDFSHTLAPIVIGALVQLIGRPISWKLINSCINLCGPAVG